MKWNPYLWISFTFWFHICENKNTASHSGHFPIIYNSIFTQDGLAGNGGGGIRDCGGVGGTGGGGGEGLVSFGLINEDGDKPLSLEEFLPAYLS